MKMSYVFNDSAWIQYRFGNRARPCAVRLGEGPRLNDFLCCLLDAAQFTWDSQALLHLGDLLVVPQVVQRDVKQPLVGIQSLEDRKRMLRVVFFQRELRVLNKLDGLGARLFEPANHLGLGETLRPD